MREILVVVSGLLAGVVVWLPCAVGLAAHRYKVGGAQIKSSNPWVLLSTRAPGSFSPLGRIVFILVMLVWLGIFFGSMAAPMLAARVLGVPEASPSIEYALYANMVVAAVAFFAGPAIWRRLAL
jgi:uncharacterized membrane protein